MNYYDARRRQDTGQWDYTRMNDGEVYPTGYCCPRVLCPCATAENGYRGDPGHDNCGGTGWIASPDYCGSHDTEQEARECFARYLAAKTVEREYADWTGCQWEELGERCDAPTKKGLSLRPPLGQEFALCDAHRTETHVRELAPSCAGQITASY